MLEDNDKPVVKTGDITDKPFGRLIALRKTDNYKKNNYKWICKCSCGNTVEVRKSSLLSGNTKSCGCLLKETLSISRKNRRINISNQKFGHLFVLYPIANKKLGKGTLWKCRCDCGKQIETTSYKLRRNLISSCGCIKPERHRTKRAIMKQQQRILDVVGTDIYNVINNDILKIKIHDSLKQRWNKNKSKHFERNFSIFERRYLQANPPTLQDIAKELGISRERARQIEKTNLIYLKEIFSS